MCLREKFNFAVVDEVDCILIDESRNPMIISSPAADSGPLVGLVEACVREMWSGMESQKAGILAAARADGANLDPDLVESRVKDR